MISDFADEHPEATVKGIDLSPIQPQMVPENCYFEVDDYALDWLDREKYDLIHARWLIGSVRDWPGFYRKCYDALVPGGWLDMAEPDARGYRSYADGGNLLPKENVLRQNVDLFIEAGDRIGQES